MGDFEGAIDDPSWHDRIPTIPAFALSEGRASIHYPDGKVAWFTRNGKQVVFDEEKSYDGKGNPLKPEDMLDARSAVIKYLESKN